MKTFSKYYLVISFFSFVYVAMGVVPAWSISVNSPLALNNQGIETIETLSRALTFSISGYSWLSKWLIFYSFFQVILSAILLAIVTNKKSIYPVKIKIFARLFLVISLSVFAYIFIGVIPARSMPIDYGLTLKNEGIEALSRAFLSSILSYTWLSKWLINYSFSHLVFSAILFFITRNRINWVRT